MPIRSPSPFKFGTPIIEAISNPIYDSVTVEAAGLASSYRFFVNTQNKNERQIHPDIISGGQLSHPKIFVIWAFRLHISEEDKIGTAGAFSTQLADVRNLVYNSWYKFHVGTKDYMVVPFFGIPSGMGLSGYFDGSAAAEGWVQNNNQGFFGSQRSINNRRITLPPQQNFYGEIIPVDNAAEPTADVEIWNFLEGEFGREVM